MFTYVHADQSWKITHIIYTRSKLGSVSDVDQIHALLDGYHKAAEDTDSLAYFSKMIDDTYYLGTDSMEIWSKAVYTAYAALYFAKRKAFNFKRTTKEHLS